MSLIFERLTLITSTLFLVSLHAEVEIIRNPGQSSDVYCPTTKNCTIICDETNSCKSSKFYLNSQHSINIECSASQSCQFVKIYGSSVASLHIVASGSDSLRGAVLYSYSTDSNVDVECIAPSACDLSHFHYMNQGTLTMKCLFDSSCYSAIVHSTVPLSLYCGGVDANPCNRLSVILPTDRALNNQSVITLSGNQYATAEMPIIIKSLFDFRNVICIDGCIADKIYISYGIQFDYYCKVSDALCISAVSAKLADTDTLTVINTYSVAVPTSLDFSGSTFDGDVLIIHPKGSYLTLVPPVINDNAWLSILCVYCAQITFQLSSIQNAVVTVGGHWGLTYCSIYAPQNHFKINTYHWANHNTFHLENAAKITINSLSNNGDVYLGDNTDVTINCRSTDSPLYGCGKTELWSSLIASQVRFGDGFWSIDCPTADGCYDYFYIRFDFEQYPCTYYDYVLNCTSTNPTKSPTKQPTQVPILPPTATPTEYPIMDPTPSPVTHHPTRSPSRHPTTLPVTHSPTQSPSKQPTASPTQFPTTARNLRVSSQPLCYSMSLEVGVTNGAFDKSEFEGLYTLNPTPFFNRPWWIMPQSTDRYIKYIGASWSIHSNDGNALIFVSNGDFPPINSDEPIWQHSTTHEYFVVLLTCVDSYSSASTLSTILPTQYPSKLPTSRNESTQFITVVLLTIIGALVVLICIAALSIYIYMSRRKRKAPMAQPENKQMQMSKHHNKVPSLAMSAKATDGTQINVNLVTNGSVKITGVQNDSNDDGKQRDREESEDSIEEMYNNEGLKSEELETAGRTAEGQRDNEIDSEKSGACGKTMIGKTSDKDSYFVDEDNTQSPIDNA